MKISNRYKTSILILVVLSLLLGSFIVIFEISMSFKKAFFLLIMNVIVSNVISALYYPSGILMSFTIKKLNGQLNRSDLIELILFLIFIVSITLYVFFKIPQ